MYWLFSRLSLHCFDCVYHPLSSFGFHLLLSLHSFLNCSFFQNGVDAITPLIMKTRQTIEKTGFDISPQNSTHNEIISVIWTGVDIIPCFMFRIVFTHLRSFNFLSLPVNPFYLSGISVLFGVKWKQKSHGNYYASIIP